MTEKDRSDVKFKNSCCVKVNLFVHTLGIPITSSFASSVYNHPFQVLRARFQNQVELKTRHGSTSYKVIPPNLFLLLKGFSTTFLASVALTVFQSISKTICTGIDSNPKSKIHYCGPIIGGYLSSVFITPLEMALLLLHKDHSHKSLPCTTHLSGLDHLRQLQHQHGVKRIFLGFQLVAIRSTLIGSSFVMFMPKCTAHLQHTYDLSHFTAMTLSGVTIGTLFSALSQPFESLRIEQQYTANDTHPHTIRQAYRALTTYNWTGLFKGGSYRIPRLAPGIFIIGFVQQELEYMFPQDSECI